ncbi:dynein axonemal assembly factor 11-like [Penaeus japonicus]|uniref:dynein axonemal assembly factor 11-like n=1 Tax=Penaeus japonicus TaxID=27405 RepID=UPI001C70DA9C|nr:dynein axonemal assembly factor 11-like [Penaeus japonicus]
MGKITVELVRKRAEHNEGELSTLEEISLHQQDIEKIEHLHRWCPRLRILYLQGNLIDTIENLGRLRELEYLNLALNNIEVVEGLGRCESLRKLDLTANFVSELTSILSLQDLPNLKELFLTGNPCTDYRGYRTWVTCALPGLEELDGEKITRSGRIRALREFTEAQTTVEADQREELEKRAKEKEKYQNVNIGNENENGTTEQSDEEWWAGRSDHTPEARLAMHREMQRRRRREGMRPGEDAAKKKRPPRLFASDGRPLNANAAKVEFDFKEDEQRSAFVLEVHTYKYLDSSQLQCDVEPWYVRVYIRGNVLQLVLLEEVRPGQSTAQRSQVTGHLLVTMPKLAPPTLAGRSREELPLVRPPAAAAPTCRGSGTRSRQSSASVLLDVSDGAGKATNSDYRNIVVAAEAPSSRSPAYSCMRSPRVSAPSSSSSTSSFVAYRSPRERPDSPGFVDDPDVPPLE